MIKYPKTPRITAVVDQLERWKNLAVVVSEKLDGSNVGVHFDGPHLRLQSRGHVLRGGERERQFDIFKKWGHENSSEIFACIGSRYVIFGEWLYAKHHIFYDHLPGWLVVYDLYDKDYQEFVDTDTRQAILEPLKLPEAPILYRGKFGKVVSFASLIGPSLYKTKDWKKHFKGPLEGTDDSLLMEGVYIKVESDGRVVGRIKMPRPEFEKVRDEHNDDWLRRPLVTNRCR